MPGVRRPVSRVQSTPPPVSMAPKSTKGDSAAGLASGTGEDKDGTTMMFALSPPKHAHIPDVPVDNNIMFEAMAFMFAVVALCLQYIHLYKTVWWLPQSHSNYALNFYLIDPYLVLFLMILMSRRLAYCFLKEVQGGRSSKSCLYWLVQLCKFVLVLALVLSFGWTGYRVILRHSLLYSLFLCYPLVMYVILFGFNMRPLFGKMFCAGSLNDKGTPKHKSKETKQQLHHMCSTSPEAVRDEVDMLKTDFNNRLKQVLFSSMLCAYYMGFVPLCFAQHVEYECDECWNTLYYDIWWVGQHVVLVWISAFVMFMVHFLPAKYIDVLHCCALHLGKWVKVEGRHAHVPYNAWSELQVWQQGALVKHVRGLFKAEGINNSAEPGNGMHARFYFMFHRPLRVTNWVLFITSILVLYQFLLLIQAAEWSHLISLAFLLFCNYYILFKLMRDRFVLGRAYKDENVSTSQ